MIKHVAKAYAQQAYRTILLAYRDMSREDYDQMITETEEAAELRVGDCLNEIQKGDVLEQELTILGMICMIDPLRDGVPDAIKVCKGAGITTIMCTGDMIDTACAISIKAGIIN
jgi:magnesium-transporting ATPase (P-type)